MTPETKQVLNTGTALLACALFIIVAALLSWAVVSDTALAYRWALGGAAAVVLTMESRVRLGLRVPRGPLFWWHLSCSVPAFLLLVLLAFVMRPAWMQYLMLALLLASFAAGALLLARGVRAHANGGAVAAASLPRTRENRLA